METYKISGDLIYSKVIEPVLTNEQKILRKSINPLDEEERNNLYQYIAENNNILASENEKTLVQSIYEKNKPNVSSEDVYNLLSATITIDTPVTGIINYLVNGNHKQLRF